MPSIELKVARIGNSRGVRLPAATLARYAIDDRVVMEEREEGILLRPLPASASRLSWTDTANAMAAAAEDWSDWDAVLADGLDHVPWGVVDEPSRAKQVAEKAVRPYTVSKARKKRSQ
jgi:antitoxin component of MazEF toxin-antitoxin module